MKKSILVGIVLAVLASAVTTSAILVVGQETEPKSPPTKALRPDQITKLPTGTPVARLALPLEVGRLRILPTGSVPSKADTPPPKPGLKATWVDLREGKTLDDCRGFSLFVEAPYVPEDRKFTGCSVNTIIWDDGETTDVTYTAGYWSKGYYPIAVSRRLLAPGEVVDLVNESDPFALTISEVGGVPAVIRHQAPGARVNGPFSVTFVTGDVLTDVEAAGIDLDELTTAAGAIAVAVQGSQQ